MFMYAINQEKEETNQVYLSGDILTQPVFSHEVFGEAFYESKIKVPRLSEAYDILPITVSERLMCDGKLRVGEKISIKGQLRSFNKQVDNKSKLLLSVFVREILDFDSSQNPNSVRLNGFLCKTPVFRTTPFNREICDLLLAVNRAYNKSDYIPAIAWGRNARFVKFLPIGQEVVLSGRLQSREYTKKIKDLHEVTNIAYEVSTLKVRIIKSKKIVRYKIRKQN